MDPNQHQQAGAASGQEDYLDKGASVIPSPLPYQSIRPLPNILQSTGLDAAERKFGQGKVDPAKERGVNEKVTDQARGMFEKMTG